MADVVKAVVLCDAGAIPPGRWDRLYYGAEFCPWRFPQTDQLLRFVDTARAAGLPVTISTPVLNESFLPRFRRQLEQLLPHLTAGDELLASDLGTIRLVRGLCADLTLVAGRVLSGQKRGPRILDLELNAEERDYFRQGHWYQAETVRYLTEQGVERVELDNLLQGVAPLPAPLVGSLHVPYAMVTSSRNCPVRPAGRFGSCPGGCDAVMRLTTPQTPVPLLQAGNTQFLENEQLPPELAVLRIDRLVRHERLPV